MFLDNLKKEDRDKIAKIIEKGKFKTAIEKAFNWDETPETNLWEEIRNDIQNVNEKSERQLAKLNVRYCKVCGVKLEGQGRDKYCLGCSTKIMQLKGTMKYSTAVDRARELVYG